MEVVLLRSRNSTPDDTPHKWSVDLLAVVQESCYPLDPRKAMIF